VYSFDSYELWFSVLQSTYCVTKLLQINLKGNKKGLFATIIFNSWSGPASRVLAMDS